MGLGSAMIGAVKKVLGIASPSKVMAELGGYTAEGFQVGLDSGQPAIQSSMQRAISPNDLKTNGATGSAGSFNATINITVNSSGEAMVDDMTSRIREALETLLADFAPT
jgi:hypothetical protein